MSVRSFFIQEQQYLDLWIQRGVWKLSKCFQCDCTAHECMMSFSTAPNCHETAVCLCPISLQFHLYHSFHSVLLHFFCSTFNLDCSVESFGFLQYIISG